MKTVKLLTFFAFSLMLLSAVTNSGTRYCDECQCKCDACLNCCYEKGNHETRQNENYYRAMSNRDLAEFKRLIGDRTFESTKLDMTKSVIDNNFFSTDQVREIINWFTFESNKLDLAKYAFNNTVDKNNYYKLYDNFVFESNVVDLDNFVKNYR